MHSQPLYPLQAEADSLLRHCKLPLHIGQATIGGQPGLDPDHPLIKLYTHFNPNAPTLADVTFDAAFLMPAAGDCLIFLQCRSDFRLHRNFGTDLAVNGESSDGPFRLHSSQFYVDAEGEGPNERRWAIARPINRPAELTYGEPRPIARVQALINNFDFESGNEPKDSGKRDILRVRAAGRIVDFVRREGYEQIKTLLKIGASAPAPLVAFSFDVWDNSSEAELADFAFQIAGLCGLVARQHTGIPLLSFLDREGRPIKRLLIRPLESPFREGYILQHLQLDRGLPQLFDQCFENYRKLMKSDRWATMHAYCKTVLDPPYLEQKCATLMSGLERLMRNSLVEAKRRSDKEAEALRIPRIFRAVEKQLGWEIPTHYSTDDRAKNLRNAVAHGGPLPLPPDQARNDLDKWSLFLIRRVLMHLGFGGLVRSPNLKAGEWQESPVDDFSEDHNSFGE